MEFKASNALGHNKAIENHFEKKGISPQKRKTLYYQKIDLHALAGEQKIMKKEWLSKCC